MKSILSNIPTYILSLSPLPAGLACRIERVFRNFLWGSLSEERKFHLVSWDKVCSLVSCGGLGICNLIGFNFGMILGVRTSLSRMLSLLFLGLQGTKKLQWLNLIFFSNNIPQWNVRLVRYVHD